MVQNREQKIEVLQTLTDYLPRMYMAVEAIVEELRGDRLVDTDEYLQVILGELGWMWKAVRGTADLINEYGTRLSLLVLEVLEFKVRKAVRAGDEVSLADILERELLPQLERTQEAALSVLPME